MQRYETIKEVRERIENNYIFLQEIRRLIFEEKNSEDKCRLYNMVGEYYANCVTGVYADEELEFELRGISETIPDIEVAKSDESNILIVMTATSEGGGHTGIASNWPKWDEKNHYSLVVTNQWKGDISYIVKDSIRKSGGELYSLKGTYYEKAQYLRALSSNYERILLVTHMQDIIPILAYGANSFAVPVYFYNHADFRFSYGMSVSDAVLNLCEYDLNVTKKVRGYTGSNYVLKYPNNGVVIQGIYDEQKKIDKGNLKNNLAKRFSFDVNKKLIVSAGDEFKFADIIGLSFRSFIMRVIEEIGDEVDFVIVGPSPTDTEWEQLANDTNNKAHAIGYIDRKSFEEIISVADLYVISFPMTAFGASVAIKYDVPYIGLLNNPRISECYNSVNLADSVDDLLQKTIDALFYDRDKYINPRKDLISKEEWQIKWYEIIKNEFKHKCSKLKPIRMIKDMEIQNAQLLSSDKKNGSMVDIIYNYSLKENEIKALLDSSEEHGIEIMPSYSYIFNGNYKLAYEGQEKMLNKTEKLFNTSYRWLNLELNGCSINGFFENNNYKEISIYGYGNMGKCLLKKLIHSGIKVIEVIDNRNIENEIDSGTKSVRPQEANKNVDVIINTTVDTNETISRQLGGCSNILSLNDILDALQY